MLSIRLRRAGTTKKPHYRVVVADSRAWRDGRFVEVLGHYDPRKDPAATRYSTITFDEALARNLQIMDATAFALCRDQRLPIKVFNITKPGALKRVVMGEDEGTLVHV